MGYTTNFTGTFKLNRPLDDETYTFLVKLADTRRMKRALPEKYGIEGEFYVDGGGPCGQDHEESILDYNNPPRTQPSLWCDWVPSDDKTEIEWNGGEKFYHYIEWIKYIIEYLKPKGYSLTGIVNWYGEDSEDMGQIDIQDNNVTVKYAKITYEGVSDES